MGNGLNMWLYYVLYMCYCYLWINIYWYVSGCGNIIFHFGSNNLWKTVPTFGYTWKYTLRHEHAGKHSIYVYTHSVGQSFNSVISKQCTSRPFKTYVKQSMSVNVSKYVKSYLSLLD